MRELIIRHDNLVNEDILLRENDFNLNLPIKSFQSKNVEGTVYQQCEGEEMMEILYDRILSLESEVLELRLRLKGDDYDE